MKNLKIGDMIYYTGKPYSPLDVKNETRSIKTGDKFMVTYISLAYPFISAISKNGNYEFWINNEDFPKMLCIKTLYSTHFINEKESRKQKLNEINGKSLYR
jgi:hypothetical protein